MKSNANYSFSKVPAPQVQRSVFDRTTKHATTFDSAYLIPFVIDEILPGDTVNLRATLFARIATLIYPIMDNVFIDTHYFYVPNRLVWTNWERFNGAQDDPDDTTDYVVPYLDLEGIDPAEQFEEGSIYDYAGLPTKVDMAWAVGPDGFPKIQSLPFRAYLKIYNEWFKDQNLQVSVPVPMDDGPDLQTEFMLLKRGKRHDYFTSALPWPQKGDSVMLPLGTSAPVIGNGRAMGFDDTSGPFNLGFQNDTGVNGQLGVKFGGNTVPGDSFTGTYPSNDVVIGLSTNPANSGVFADLTAATAATVNQLRQAFAFQKILERDARGGTRYVELLKAHFGVTSPDFRLQRPEYLGGSSQPMHMREVPSTAPTPASPTDRNVQGTLSAYGTANSKSGFSKSFVEHGWVIGLVSVRSDMTYQQNIRRMWTRSTRFDYYLPALANLGEQVVQNMELVYDPAGVGALLPNAAFGYQERWAEYRYFPSMVTGQFRSNATGSLDAWHLAFDYATVPPLNENFIVDDPPIDRVVAVPGTVEIPAPQILLDTHISIRHARPMPVFSVPGQIDRF